MSRRPVDALFAVRRSLKNRRDTLVYELVRCRDETRSFYLRSAVHEVNRDLNKVEKELSGSVG